LEAVVRSLIASGMIMLENDQNVEALSLFEKATREAQQIGNSGLEGKAFSGLASSYLKIPEMAEAAPGMFEMAAQMFGTAGDPSDRITMLAEAGEAYRKIGDPENAIRCLKEHDDANEAIGGNRVFASLIERISKSAAKPKRRGYFY